MKTPKDFQPKKPTPKMWNSEPESVKSTSLKNEKRLSKRLGFKLTPGSGNQAWASKKGDGFTKEFLFECKETQKDRFTILPDVLAKLHREAGTVGKHSALIISMYGLTDPVPKEWVAIPMEVFEELIEEWISELPVDRLEKDSE